MLANSERFRLLGTYATPAFQYGDIVEDERRGEVEIVALTDAPIPWPTGRPTKEGHRRKRAIVLFDCLADAVRSEATQAVAHWWGVTSQTVTVWRNALGCDRIAPGTRRLHQLNFAAGVGEAMAAKRPESLQRPERGRKISLAKKGKPRPDVAKRNLKRRGSKGSAETRQKMSEAHRRRGPVAREGYRPWTATEDELVRTLPASEVAQQTGRTLSAVNQRRNMLGVRERSLLRFSPADDELIRTLSLKEAAKRIGRSSSAIRNRRYWLRVSPRTEPAPPDFSTAEDELISTLPPKEAAERLGRTVVSIYKRRCRLGIARGRTVE